MPLFLTATAIMMAGAYFASTDNEKNAPEE